MVAAASVSHGRQRGQFIVHDGGTSALGVGFREADPRPWKTMPGKRLRLRQQRWTGSSRRTRSSMRQMHCGGRVRQCKGEEHEGCGVVEKSILRWG